MKFEELLQRFEQNAEQLQKPNSVEIPGVGLVYVRKRTILEYEHMTDLRRAMADTKKEAEEEGTEKFITGILAQSLARLLCDENGKRFTHQQEDVLAGVLANQPEDVLHLILNAADGIKKEETTEGK